MKLIASFVLLLFSFTSFYGPQQSLKEVFKEPKTILIKSTLNKSPCNNKAYIPIEVPKKSVGLIYSIKTVRKSEYKNPKKELLSQLQSLDQEHEAAKLANFLVVEGTQRNFNYYTLSDLKNVNAFNNCGQYNYDEKFINTKSQTGYLSVDNNQEVFYLGIENNRDMKNLRLVIEVVAVLND